MSERTGTLRTPCVRCGCAEGVFTASGPHTKATCKACGEYCYFAPKPGDEKTPPANRRKPWSGAEVSELKRLQAEFAEGKHETNGFVSSLLEQYEKFGGLTEGQWSSMVKAYKTSSTARPVTAAKTVSVPIQTAPPKEHRCSFCNDNEVERDGTNGFCACTERASLSEEHKAKYDAIQAHERNIYMPTKERPAPSTAPVAKTVITGATLLDRLIAAKMIHSGQGKRVWSCSNCGEVQEVGAWGYFWRNATPGAPSTGNTCCAPCVGRLCSLLEGAPR